MPGRPAVRPSPDKVQLVPDEHRREDVDVLCTAMNLRKDHDIRYSKVYLVMKENGPAALSAAKSGRQKHSNSIWMRTGTP